MKKKIFQNAIAVVLVAMVITSLPAGAKVLVNNSLPTAVKTVSRGIPSATVPANSASTAGKVTAPPVSAEQFSAMTQLLVANGTLTAEQAAKILELYNKKPGYISSEELMAGYEKLMTYVNKTVAELNKVLVNEGYLIVLPELNSEDLVAILNTLSENGSLAEFAAAVEQSAAKIQTIINNNSLEGSAENRQKAVQLLLVMDMMMVKYADTLRNDVVPVSTLSGTMKILLTDANNGSLSQISRAYQASIARLQQIDTSNPTSAAAIKQELAVMWFDQSNHKSYFEQTAWPIIGSVQVLLSESSLRYLNSGLNLVATQLNKSAEILTAKGYYTDALSAKSQGVNYLTGNADKGGKILERINQAVELAQKIITAGGKIEGENYPGKYVGFAVRDMKTVMNLLNVKIDVQTTK